MRIGSLFSGIGGLERGLEMCGMGPVNWQAESDYYARQVLRRQWPQALLYDDVRQIGVDIICGGFPCQDISDAGTNHVRRALDGPASGLWGEFERIIGLLQPTWVFIENVASLAERGLGRVLRSLATQRYDAEWGCFTACAAGAPHSRARLFLVAHTNGNGESARALDAKMASMPPPAIDVWHGRTPPPGALGVAHGHSRELDRLRLAGNAVVPSQAALAWRELVRRFAA